MIEVEQTHSCFLASHLDIKKLLGKTNYLRKTINQTECRLCGLAYAFIRVVKHMMAAISLSLPSLVHAMQYFVLTPFSVV